MNSWKPNIQKRRRFLRGSFFVAFFMFVSVVGIYHKEVYLMLKTAVLTAGGTEVESIQVEGLIYSETENLKTALDIESGDSLIGYDAAAARKRLEALPWVKAASVEKKLPKTLIVNIYEYVPAARVEEDGDWFVVNKDAVRILKDTENQFARLPALSGVGAAEATAELLSQLQDYPNFTSQLKSANYVGERRWDFTFKNGVLVRFPEDDIKEAFSILSKLESERHVLSLMGGVVDLRLPGKITLKIPPEIKKTPVL